MFVFTIFLWWCQKTSVIEMDFLQASNIFSNQTAQQTKVIKNLFYTWFQHNTSHTTIKWENIDFLLNWIIQNSWQVAYDDLQYDVDSILDIKFLDKKNKNKFYFSGKIQLKNILDQSFFNIQDFYLDLWAGNYQWDLTHIILESLSNKRIKTDNHQIQKILTDKKFIQVLLETISNTNIFVPQEQVKYDGNLAYRVLLSEEIVNWIYSQTQMLLSDFKWKIVIKNTDDVFLQIDNLMITNKENLIIKWHIGKNDWEINISNKQNQNQKNKIVWKLSPKEKEIIFKKIKNHHDIVTVSLKIYSKHYVDKVINELRAVLQISPLFIYWSSLEKEIKININSKQTLKTPPFYNIKKPDSYIILDQLLWDNFSLQKILYEKNNLLTWNNDG